MQTKQQHIDHINANYDRIAKDAAGEFASKKIKATLPTFRAISDEVIAQVALMTDAELAQYGFAQQAHWRDVINTRTNRALKAVQ